MVALCWRVRHAVRLVLPGPNHNPSPRLAVPPALSLNQVRLLLLRQSRRLPAPTSPAVRAGRHRKGCAAVADRGAQRRRAQAMGGDLGRRRCGRRRRRREGVGISRWRRDGVVRCDAGRQAAGPLRVQVRRSRRLPLPAPHRTVLPQPMLTPRRVSLRLLPMRARLVGGGLQHRGAQRAAAAARARTDSRSAAVAGGAAAAVAGAAAAPSATPTDLRVRDAVGAHDSAAAAAARQALLRTAHLPAAQRHAVCLRHLPGLRAGGVHGVCSVYHGHVLELLLHEWP